MRCRFFAVEHSIGWTKDAFWNVVADLLIDLFRIAGPVARQLTLDRRADVDLAPAHLRSDVFYHREPFDVASNLAVTFAGPRGPLTPTLDDPPSRLAYEQILHRHGLA